MTMESIKTTTDNNITEKELFNFDADMSQLMNIIVNNFYSNRDIFLRELLSNSSDAINKIRYQKVNTNNDDKNIDHEIKIYVNKDLNVLTIEDTGIGMNKEDIINNLGKIASSGTKKFMSELQEKKDMTNSLIGQFGVGFYSSFLVADKVKVISKKYNEDNIYEWESNGGCNYYLTENNENELKYGTKIELYLKEDCHDYLDEHRLKNIVNEHSQYIYYPIKLLVTKTRDVEVTEEEKDSDVKSDDEDTEGVKIEEVMEEKEENEKQSNEKKTIQESYDEWEQLNDQKSLWIKDPENVSEEEYKSFYNDLNKKSYGPSEYHSHKHFSVEGQILVKGLLYIPKVGYNPFMMKENDKNIKLYVKRVFLSDKCKDLVPQYLDFVKGVVDCEDIPLTVSREMLQESKTVEIIKKVVKKQILGMFTDLMNDEEKYLEFYKEYSKNIKAAYHEETKNDEKFIDLFRFYSSKNNTKMISLDNYISNMKDEQSGIYYISGDNVELLNNSPYLEVLKSKDIDVLYFTETIDEYISQKLNKYKDQKFICITKDKLELDNKKETNKEDENSEYTDLCKKIETIFKEDLEKVVISDRIVNSPCCLVSTMSANMERIMKSQPLENSNNFMFNRKKILEINTNHSLIIKLNKIKDLEDNTEFINLLTLLYDTTCILNGYTIKDPQNFSKKLYEMMDNGVENHIDNISTIDNENTKLKNLDTNNEEEKNKSENIDTSTMENMMKNIDPSMMENMMKNIDPNMMENMMKNIDPNMMENMMKNIDPGTMENDTEIENLEKEVKNLEKELESD